MTADPPQCINSRPRERHCRFGVVGGDPACGSLQIAPGARRENRRRHLIVVLLSSGFHCLDLGQHARLDLLDRQKTVAPSFLNGGIQAGNEGHALLLDFLQQAHRGAMDLADAGETAGPDALLRESVQLRGQADIRRQNTSMS